MGETRGDTTKLKAAVAEDCEHVRACGLAQRRTRNTRAAQRGDMAAIANNLKAYSMPQRGSSRTAGAPRRRIVNMVWQRATRVFLAERRSV